VENAAALAQALLSRGYRLVSGGPTRTLLLIDLSEGDTTGKEAQERWIGPGYRQQEHGAVREAESDGDERDPDRDPGRHQPGTCARPRWPRSPRSSTAC